jgi:hypothetical protein
MVRGLVFTLALTSALAAPALASTSQMQAPTQAPAAGDALCPGHSPCPA